MESQHALARLDSHNHTAEEPSDLGVANVRLGRVGRQVAITAQQGCDMKRLICHRCTGAAAVARLGMIRMKSCPMQTSSRHVFLSGRAPRTSWKQIGSSGSRLVVFSLTRREVAGLWSGVWPGL